jgi:signal peptidase I
MSAQRARKPVWREWLESILLAVAVIFAVRNFIVEPFRIPTGSMEPTLNGVKRECPVCRRVYHYDDRRCSVDGSSLRTARIGDRILVNKFIYGSKTPDRIPFTGILLPYLKLPALRPPRRGDIVVFHYPEDLKVDFVKRLAGLPGESLEIREGRILIDGKPVTDPAFARTHYFNQGDFAVPGRAIRIPQKGDRLSLSPRTLPLYRQLLINEGHSVEEKNGQVFVDGVARSEHTAGANHYFLLGDNSANSKDSRVWGFVPERHIVGNVFFIYWPPRRWGIPK